MEQLIEKGILMGSIVSAATKAATKAVIQFGISKGISVLAWPVIGPVASFIVEKVIESLYNDAATFANLMWIRLENAKELKAAIGSRENLQKALEGGDIKLIKKAEDEFDKAADDLIKHRTDRLPK